MDLTWFDGRDLLLLIVVAAFMFHLGRLLGRVEGYDDGYDDGRVARLADPPPRPVLQLVLQLVPRRCQVYDFDREGA